MFYKGVTDDFIAISVNVEDQTIIARSLPPVTTLKQALASMFGMDDLGETTSTVEFEVRHNSASMSLLLEQKKLISTVLERLSMYVQLPCSISMDPVIGALLSKGQSRVSNSVRDAMAAIPYRQLIVSLMYPMEATRPNPSFWILKLS